MIRILAYRGVSTIASVFLIVLLIAIATVGLMVYGISREAPSSTTVIECCTMQISTQNTNFTWSYNFPIVLSYDGSWNLVYQGYNDTIPKNIMGNQSGVGNYSLSVTLYGRGYVQRTLCANATKLDPQNSNLTLKVDYRSNSTSLPYGKAIVCETVAP
jgi:predicted PurR-regulated permease PerM